jgi:hypothetical protein
LVEAGFTVSAFPDNVLSGRHDIPRLPADKHVVYRGWMLLPRQYENLSVAILARDSTPYVPAKEYVLAHYLPNWYPFIRDLTPTTRFLPDNSDFEEGLKGLPGPFFVKDHVKSLKEESFVDNPAGVKEVVDKMRSQKGRIEGGVCVRNVENFIPDTERRYFVVDGTPYSSDASPAPEIVAVCSRRIPSRFFSVDVAKRDDGVDRVVEIGDGQVSDLVGWDPANFAAIWKNVKRPAGTA